jgi:hypothetical protein
MFTSKVIALVSEAKGDNIHNNKHEKTPLYLNVLNGEYPNKNIMDGTVAEDQEVEVGNCYLFQIKEIEKNEEYGRQFAWTKIGLSLTAMEVVQLSPLLKDAKMINVLSSKGIEATINEVAEEFNNEKN